MVISYSHSQQVALALVPKLTGFLSFSCSSYIVYSILKDQRRRHKVYHRLICGTCVIDVLSSISFGLSTWPIPRDAGMLWASGTMATCQAQAFVNQVAIGSPLYNGALSIYYLLSIQYSWEDTRIQRYEWIFHLVPLGWAFGTATAALVLGIYGPAILWCGSGSAYDIYRWIFFYGPLWLMILVVTTSCIAIWLHVRRTERKSHRWSESHQLMSGPFQQTSSQLLHASKEQSLDGQSQRSRPVGDSSQHIPSSLVSQPHQHVGLQKLQLSSEQLQSSSSHFRLSRRSAKKIRKLKMTRQVATQSFLYAGAFYLNWTAVTVRMLSSIL